METPLCHPLDETLSAVPTRSHPVGVRRYMLFAADKNVPASSKS